MSGAPKPNGTTPPTVTAVLKHGGEYAIVERCPFCHGRHFVRLEPGLQRANCDVWHPRAKGGYVVVFDAKAKR